MTSYACFFDNEGVIWNSKKINNKNMIKEWKLGISSPQKINYCLSFK